MEKTKVWEYCSHDLQSKKERRKETEGLFIFPDCNIQCFHFIISVLQKMTLTQLSQRYSAVKTRSPFVKILFVDINSLLVIIGVIGLLPPV